MPVRVLNQRYTWLLMGIFAYIHTIFLSFETIPLICMLPTHYSLSKKDGQLNFLNNFIQKVFINIEGKNGVNIERNFVDK